MGVTGWNIWDQRRRTILVTGASGFLGAKLVKELSALPEVTLILVGNKNSLQAPSQSQAKCEILQWDLSDTKSLASKVTDVASKHQITDVIHLASPNPTESSFDQLVQVNVNAFQTIVNAVAPQMVRRQGGLFLVVGSLYAEEPPADPRLLNYSMAKAMLKTATSFFHRKFSATGLVFRHIAPGPIDSPLNRLTDNDQLLNAGKVASWLKAVIENPEDLSFDTVLRFSGSSEGLEATGSTGMKAAHIGRTSTQQNVTVQNQSAPNSKNQAESISALYQVFRSNFTHCARFSDDRIESVSMDNSPEWDSLGQLRLVVAVEEALAVKIPSKKIKDLRSFSAFKQLVVGTN